MIPVLVAAMAIGYLWWSFRQLFPRQPEFHDITDLVDEMLRDVR